MAFLNKKQQGIILLVAAILIWAPLPGILPWETLAAFIALILGIYNLASA
jgi:hypothetical protein